MSRTHRQTALAAVLLGMAAHAAPLLSQEPRLLPPPGQPSVGTPLPAPVTTPNPVLKPVLQPGPGRGTVPVVIPSKELEQLDRRAKGAAPAYPTATATGPFAVAINWQDVPGALSYKVYRLLEGGGVPVVFTFAPLPAAPLKAQPREKTLAAPARFTDSGLLPATTFSYVVEAVYPDTIIPGKTEAVSATTPAPPPVTGLTATAVGLRTPQEEGYRVELSWGPAPGAARYIISRHQNQSPIATVAATQSAAEQAGPTYSYVDDRHIGADLSERIVGQEVYYFGVSPGSYYYQVLPVYVLGSMERVADKATAPGVPVEISSKVVDARPQGSAPIGVSATATGIQTIAIGWADLPWATDYRVYRSEVSATGPFLGAHNVALATPRKGAERSYTDGGRAPGATYYYKIEAFYSDSGPSASQVVSATTPAAPPVAGLTGKGNALSAELHWKASPGASGYYVYRDGKDIAHLAGQTSYLSGKWIPSDTAFTEQLSPGTYSYKVLPIYSYGANENLDLSRHPAVAVKVLFPTIRGFVDTHTHPFANLASGGKVFFGPAFGPIATALAVCNNSHGQDGLGDVIGNIYRTKSGNISLGHNTGGFPDFGGWPTYRTLTHQQMHSDWIYRAFQGGLRLMVAHAVNNALLCEVAPRDPGGPGRPPRTCDDMEAVDLQIDAAKEMEAYIDGQSGGAGKGWFRIAYTPEQARQIILDGKLAVVLGIEVDKLFGCGKGECDANKVDTELARYYGKGVRHLFPVHLADNAFGGFALTGEDLFKLNSTLANPGGAFGPGVKDETCSSRGFDRPCNTRTLTPLGAHLIRSMMNKGMIIDIDHMGMHTTDDVLALTGPRKYPVVSGHTGFVGTADAGHSSEREKSDGWLADINKDGGMVSVGMSADAAKSYTPTWRGAVANTCPGTTRTMAQSYLYAVDKMGGPDNAAVGLATDQFLTKFAAPRFDGHCPGESPATKVTYPMATRSGEYLGASKAGNRTFDYNTEGLAHFGLLPELIQDLKNEGLTDRDLDPLFRSAEGYIRMWERAVASVPVP